MYICQMNLGNYLKKSFFYKKIWTWNPIKKLNCTIRTCWHNVLGNIFTITIFIVCGSPDEAMSHYRKTQLALSIKVLWLFPHSALHTSSIPQFPISLWSQTNSFVRTMQENLSALKSLFLSYSASSCCEEFD